MPNRMEYLVAVLQILIMYVDRAKFGRKTIYAYNLLAYIVEKPRHLLLLFLLT